MSIENLVPDENLCKQVRTKMDMSQEKFAELLGTHSMTISRYERGADIPTNMRLLMLLIFDTPQDKVNKLHDMLSKPEIVSIK